MKVIDIINNTLNEGAKRFSFELLPPSKGDGPDKVYGAIERLARFNPAFINVTCHREEVVYNERPDGLIERHVARRRPGTVGISAAIMQRFGIPVVPHVICGGQSRYDIEDTLIDLDLLDIHNVLALRGDAMSGDKRFVPHPQGYSHARELVEHIMATNRGEYLDGKPGASHQTNFCVGVAAYPEKHSECPNLLTDIDFLKQKIDAGAQYIATQICYDTNKLLRFRDKCRQAGIDVPIIPGLKPFARKSQLSMIPQTFSVDLPQQLVEQVMACDDVDDVRRVGVDWAVMQGERLYAEGFPLLHFYTMTRTGQMEQILTALL